ncbi:MAG: NAD(P)-dependent alcohol dehydrogenase [Pseudomonadota bacterium]|nr:NAD(P)-dependent alcohol dehydrogenase [Pseudomonadota bacterium]
MSTQIRAWATHAAGQNLEPFAYDAGALPAEHVEIHVEHCGICHSDLSMIDNEWRRATYPLVPGHEAVGTVVARGEQVKGLKVGDRVGIGWFAASCMHCGDCRSGDLHFCSTGEQTIIGRHGGFADRMRCHWAWAAKLPAQMDYRSAGPLFCGGITVFSPIVEFGVKPTDRVGVVGIGGLGHMAVQFLNKWGCEVTAFTSSDAKRAEALSFGAHHTVSSTDKAALKALVGKLDFILVTVAVNLEWAAYLRTLAPRGRLHFVGMVAEPLGISGMQLVGNQRSVSGSPLGRPTTVTTMLDFCARHKIAPLVEHFPMSKVNEAIDHLRSGKARYRIVLDA